MARLAHGVPDRPPPALAVGDVVQIDLIALSSSAVHALQRFARHFPRLLEDWQSSIAAAIAGGRDPRAPGSSRPRVGRIA